MKDNLILEAINGLSRRIEKLDDKIDNFKEELDSKIDAVDEKVDKNTELLQAQMRDLNNKIDSNTKNIVMALNTAMLSLDRQIKEVKAENDKEHQEFKKYLKIS